MKHFNIIGTCIPDRHFMADRSQKLDQIAAMVAKGDYFTINRPRQYGKTTTIFLLAQRLQKDKDYLPIDISFEEIGSATYERHHRFISDFLRILKRRLDFMGEKELAAAIGKEKDIDDIGHLSEFITDLIAKTNRKVVLMIDEVDKSANHQLFLDFLGMLRAKYLKQSEGKDHTFHSVILAGVHDIKSLKAKINPAQPPMYNSPWNIAVDFEVNLSLSPSEIESMLTDYVNERGLKMDIPLMAEKIFYYTSGYPFLVSYLCKMMDETSSAAEGENHWTLTGLEEAVQAVLKKSNTNFDNLVKNLENNPELYDLVYRITMNGRKVSFNLDNPLINLGFIHGIFRAESGKTIIHNRLYEQRIYNYMASKLETSGQLENRIQTTTITRLYWNP